MEIVLPILTLLLGWGLKATEPLFGSRRDRRRALGEAILELLEHYVVVLELQRLLESLESDLGQTPEALLAKQKASFGRPDSDMRNMSGSYVKARIQIAAHDPVLALELHAAGSVRKWLVTALQTAAGESDFAPELYQLQVRYLKSAERALASAATRLSWRHGFLTWFRVRNVIRHPARMLAAGQDFAEIAKGIIREYQQGAQPGGGA